MKSAWRQFGEMSEGIDDWIKQTHIAQFAARPLIGIMFWLSDAQSDSLRAISYDADTHHIEIDIADEVTEFERGKLTAGIRLLPIIIGLPIVMMVFKLSPISQIGVYAGHLIPVAVFMLIFAGIAGAMNVRVTINGQEVDDDG
jgi:hypothetical protein